MRRPKSDGPIKLVSPDTAGAYPRTRLFRALDGLRKQPLVWLTAPAGSGKTSLLASYVARRRLETVFYRLDRGDEDPATFFHFLRTAWLARSRRRNPDRIPRYTPEVVDPHAFARRFFGACFESSRASWPDAIVFDDGHELGDHAPIWPVLYASLAAFPATVPIIVASRRPPPPVFARGIAHREIGVLTFDALRLTVEESRGLLKARFPGNGSQTRDAAAAMHERSGGWAAGLMLLASAGDLGGPGAAPLERSGAPEHLFAYFATEIFAHLRPEIRLLAVRTAVPRTVDLDLAGELFSVEERALLPELARAISLVHREGAGFRYHALLRTFLLAKAAEELGPDGLADFRRRACRALLAKHRDDEAFELARESGDPAALRAVVVDAAPRLLGQGRVGALEIWTEAFSRETLLGDPLLALVRAQSILMKQPPEARRLFEVAAASADPVTSALAVAGALHAVVFEGDDFKALDPWIDRALSLDPEALPPPVGSMLTAAVVGMSGFRRPGDPGIRRFARHAHRLVRSSVEDRVRLGGILVFHETFFGDPRAVEGVVSELWTDGQAATSEPLARVTMTLGRAVSCWLRGDVPGALDAVAGGLSVANTAGVHVWDDQLYAIGAASTIAAERFDEARAFQEPLARAAARSRFAKGNADFYRAWAAFTEGDLETAERFATHSHAYGTELGSPFAVTLSSTLIARIAIARKAFSRAREHLDEVEHTVKSTGSAVNTIPIWVARAELAFAEDRADEERAALEALCEAIGTTGVSGYFLVSRRDLASCASRALARGIAPAFVRELARGLELDAPAAARGVQEWPWRARVAVFGPVTLLTESARVQAARQKRKNRGLELLATVVALGPGPVPVARVCDQLWPESEGDAARASFDTTLLRLRKELGHGGSITLLQGFVELAPGTVFVDLFAAEEWLKKAQRATERGATKELELAAAELERLVRGPLFENVAGALFEERTAKFERSIGLLAARVLASPHTAARALAPGLTRVVDALRSREARAHLDAP